VGIVSGGGGGASGAGTEIGYDQITAIVNIVGTSEGAPTTVITCAAHVFDGQPVIATFYCIAIIMGTSAPTFNINLYETGAVVQRLAYAQGGSALGMPILVATRFTPTAASHTYTIGAWVPNTTGAPSLSAGAGGAGNNPPAYVRFTKA